jgi:hypothetical protein
LISDDRPQPKTAGGLMMLEEVGVAGSFIDNSWNGGDIVPTDGVNAAALEKVVGVTAGELLRWCRWW